MTRRSFVRAPDGQRRADLIRATLDCIAARGLHGATVRDIAERAGVSNGLVRHYFDGKDQMIQAAYRETMSRMTSQAAATIGATGAGAGPARDRLRRFVYGTLTPPVVDPRTLSLWAAFISTIHADPAMARIHREAYLDFRHIVEGLVAEVLAEAGRPADPDETEHHAITINALMDGLWLEGCLAGELFDGDQLARAAIRSVEAILGLPLSS